MSMLVEAKAIIKRLSRICTSALEGAVVQCVNARHYEVTVEHLLLALLDDANSDVAFLVMHYDLDPARLRTALQRSLSDLRTGNAGKPVFSPTMLEWMQDAWTVGSVEYGFAKVRSGMLFQRLLIQTSRYTMSGVGALLEGVSREDIKNNLQKIISGSKEEAESIPAATGGGGGGGAGGLPAGAGSAAADSALAKYCVDYTGRARAGQVDPIFGRESEIRQMIDILGRRRKNNPIIVGDSGVGKTALVEGLALMIVNNQVPPLMQGVEIMGLDLGLLQAGAAVKGEFENRMKQVISEIKGSPKPIIMFIDEAHTIIGAGNQQGAGDAANLLKPALARGELRTIAATTWAEYKKYFEKDAALARRFQPVKVDEPSEAVAITMIRGLRSKFEEAHNVIVTDEAVVAAVKLSARFISGRLLPDKAVDLLDTCSAKVKIALQQKPAQVEDIEVRIQTYSTELAALKRDREAGITILDPERIEQLESKIEKAKVDLEKVSAAYTVESEGAKKVLEVRKRMNEAKSEAERDVIRKEVVAAIDELHKSQGELPLIRPDVDEAMVAAVVSAWTGIPAGKMQSDNVKALVEMEARLNARIKGQNYGLETVAKELRSARAGLKPTNTPMGVFLFVGPSGVGKTETALALADMLFGGERMMVTINMSEFQEKHTTSRLIGSPPGYVGYGEGGMLTEGVRQRPYTVVLLDECEKADPDVMNLFYQVFDKGMLTDGTGLLVDFKNTVIILTSNLATDKITNHVVSAWEENREPVIREIYEEIKPTLSAHFKPALLARMTVVPYIPISPAALGEITRLKLNSLVDRLKKSQRIEATYSDRMVDLIASRCTEVDTGARNIDHILRASLYPLLSQEILSKMAEGVQPKKLFIDIDDNKNFVATFPE
ncbi:MAG TPA: type VI secretion system ATPase TssH [Polyangium sp.]|nr:type VI secretion system ATPase TssH [Polyangium sp.]